MQWTRFPGNPILQPDPSHPWEQTATFNGCPIVDNETTYLVYRAQDTNSHSTIGLATATDRITFTSRRQILFPQYDWEHYGCEDPRITKIGETFYIFYTALGSWPPKPDTIRVALAKTKNFQTFEKHLITPFNAKAMTLFSEPIDGVLTAILTVNTDTPPACMAMIQFDCEEDLWNEQKWKYWYSSLDHHILPVMRTHDDQVEVGAPPVKTSHGWLLFYSHILNYSHAYKNFGIEALLLAQNNPTEIVGRTHAALLHPEEHYEITGLVPNIVFPSGALMVNDSIGLYYGAADTTTCLATCPLDQILSDITSPTPLSGVVNKSDRLFTKSDKNPILQAIPEHAWESRFTLNPAAIETDGAISILYRAQGKDGVSTMGLATSQDGIHMNTRLPHPVYVPRIPEESAGVEDPRLTRIDHQLYMCYTAYDAHHPTRVALTSITVENFINHQWNWTLPQLISPPEHHDKDACLFPEKIDGKYVFLHRLQTSVWIDMIPSLSFPYGNFIQGDILFGPREDNWDSEKVGIGPPPIKTADGWLLLYHAISKQDNKYRMGALLLDLNNPKEIIRRLTKPILEPESDYQRRGARPGTVFGCGMVVRGDIIFLYYGGADQVVCVATASLKNLLTTLRTSH